MTDAQILRRIGANIRQARHAANLTQEGLAELAGIHWKTLGYIEAGKRDFGVTHLAHLSASLGVSGNQLLEGITAKAAAIPTAVTTRKRRRSPN